MMITLGKVRNIYDRAYQYDGLMGTDLDHEYDAVTKQTLLGFAEPLLQKRILDVGTGVGSLWDYVPSDTEAHAVDLSLTGLIKAVIRRPDLVASVSMAEYLPYPDGYFDCIVAADTIEHTFSPSQVLGEIGRVLRPGGDFCASFPAPNSLRKWGWNRLIRRPAGISFLLKLGWMLVKRTVLFGRPDFQPINRDLRIGEWKEMIEQQGFIVNQTLEWPRAPEIPIVYLLHALREE